MSTYISPYYCIATSGTTRDGRVIKPEMLTSAAETYDPEEAEALLWYEHSRWYRPGGAVVDCKTKLLDDQRVQLLARIKPTASLMYEAEHSEVPYLFSVELRPMEDGRYYLDGLAYTHDPASKAVDKMEFSQNRPDVVIGEEETVDKLEFKAKGWLSGLLSKQPPAPPKRAETPPKRETFAKTAQDADTMTPEQMTDLKQHVAAAVEKFAQDTKTMLDSMKNELDALKELPEKFSNLENAQKETHTIVEEIGNTSAGRFRRKPAAGQGGNADDAADINY